MERMRGIIVPIVTPFDDNDQIDYQATEELVDFLIKKGVNSLYPCGTTGEMLKMTLQERKDFSQAVVKFACHRVPVFIHVGAPTTKETIDLAQHALSIGAAGVGVVTPQFFGVNDREMEQFYVDVANCLPENFPVYLYNIPQCSGNDIKPEVIDRILQRTKNIVGIKYSYPDFIRVKNYLLCNNGKFDVVFGPDRAYVPSYAYGCVGTVTGCAQCCPEPFVEIQRALDANDWEAARLAQIKATELCEIVHVGANMAYFKEALALQGLPVMKMRKPALGLSLSEKKVFDKAFSAYLKKYGY